jgi:hypothetical protein
MRHFLSSIFCVKLCEKVNIARNEHELDRAKPQRLVNN